MKRILILTPLFLILLATASHAQDKKAWAVCNEDSDCVVTRDECGNAISVNKRYLKEAEDHRKEYAPKTNCSSAEPENLEHLKTSCQFRKTACIKTRVFGLIEEIDHESTCVDSQQTCGASP